MKPLLKITFKEPQVIWQDKEIHEALFAIVENVETSSRVNNILADGNVLSLNKIKLIEFIQPNEL